MFVPTEKPTQFTSAEKKKILSKDFRTIAVSTIGANANDNLIQVMLGLEILDADTMQDGLMEEVRLVMTPRTLKMVQMTLTNLVQRLESVLGEIPVGPPPPVQLEKKELK
jgi:hypothetical protein